MEQTVLPSPLKAGRRCVMGLSRTQVADNARAQIIHDIMRIDI